MVVVIGLVFGLCRLWVLNPTLEGLTSLRELAEAGTTSAGGRRLRTTW